MATSKFTSQDLQKLLIKYNSELRILEYQVDKAKKEIDDLNKKLDTVLAREQKAAARASKTATKKTGTTRRRGRPRKTTSTSTTSAKKSPGRPKKSPGRPKKSTTTAKATSTKSAAKTKATSSKAKKGAAKGTRQRKLSEWDQFVIDTLQKSQHAMISSELLDKAIDYNKKKTKDKLTQVQLKRKLNQVLHKLVNKRGDVVKTKYSGKGNAYALPEWMAPNGRLKKEFNRA